VPGSCGLFPNVKVSGIVPGRLKITDLRIKTGGSDTCRIPGMVAGYLLQSDGTNGAWFYRIRDGKSDCGSISFHEQNGNVLLRFFIKNPQERGEDPDFMGEK